MRHILLSILLVFTLSLNAQYVVMAAVDLNDGAEDDYIKLEKFWSEIHKEALAQNLHTGWSVWKRTPKEGDQESAPEYFIFETYSSLEQLQNGYNALEIAQNVYKRKMSKRNIQRMVQSDASNSSRERRFYVLEAVDATIQSGGSIKPGDRATINLMTKKTDDFENYESEVWKPVAEKNILKGNLRHWVLAKVINRSDNAYSGWSHLAWNLSPSQDNFYVPSGFKWDKLWEGIQSSRDMADATELTCVFSVN